MNSVVDRNAVVECWGTPAETIGSVNEPREMEEHGHRFNEKWVYRLAQPGPDQPSQRWIYWHRYDFVASYLVGPSGDLRAEDLVSLLATVPDRRFHSHGTPDRRTI